MLSLKERIAQAKSMPQYDEVIRWRVEYLDPQDRDLVDAVVLRGVPVSVVSGLTGASQTSLRRRVQTLLKRMKSKRFVAAMRSLPYLDADEACLARLAYCQGHSQRQICREMKTTCHAVRRGLDKVSAKIRLINKLPEPGVLLAQK